MIRPPSPESVVIVGDDACLLAEISSFFRRAGHYLCISDGPRTCRPDASNEAIRRTNTIARINPQRILFAGLSEDASNLQSSGIPAQKLFNVSSRDEAANALKGLVRPRPREFWWPPSNLGVGLLLARQDGASLVVDKGAELRPEAFVQAGTHALVICESDIDISQIVAANLSFSIGASFLVMAALSKQERAEWLEDLYMIGSPDQRQTFSEIAERARKRLPNLALDGRFSEIIFVTSDFPWGMAVPECPTSHIFDYPDIGRIVGDAVWAASNPSTTARTALLINPGEVNAEEIEVMQKALNVNRTLTRVMKGRRANVHLVDMTVRTMPFDLIAISTHSGDWNGRRLTYEYPDLEGRMRRLVLDEAIGIGYDPTQDLFPVKIYYKFRSLDGVSWSDDEAKERLPVGSAMTAWYEHIRENRHPYLVAQEPIDRVRGATAMRMSDHVWILGGEDMASGALPIVINNACSSFHNLAGHFTFGGARAYIGTLFPITDYEAHEISNILFGREMGRHIAHGLWSAQNSVYEAQPRRPYVLVGLPFSSICRNVVDSPSYLRKEIVDGITAYDEKARHHPDESVRRNSILLRNHLTAELMSLDDRFRNHQ